MDEVNITYESLFELLMIEKRKEELLPLPVNFLNDVASYVRDKQTIVSNPHDTSNPFASSEKEKTKIQLDQIRKMLRDLYDRREKKILFMAINKSRTGTNIVDTTPLLPEEKRFFDETVSMLDKYRAEILLPLFSGERQKAQAETAVKETKLVKFVQAVPQFMGKELEIYGPFDEEDMANLPTEVADVLIGKGRAKALDW